MKISGLKKVKSIKKLMGGGAKKFIKSHKNKVVIY